MESDVVGLAIPGTHQSIMSDIQLP